MRVFLRIPSNFTIAICLLRLWILPPGGNLYSIFLDNEGYIP